MSHEDLLTHVSLLQLSAKLAKEGLTGVKLRWFLKDGQDQQSQKLGALSCDCVSAYNLCVLEYVFLCS